MKIAVFHNLPSGGAKRALFEWVSRLADDHKIDVYSLETADHFFCDIRSYCVQHKVYGFKPHKLFESPFGRLNQFQRWRDLVDLEHLHRKIAAQINYGGYDVLFANTCKFTFIPALMQYVNIPSVYYLHEPFGQSFLRNFDRPYLSKDSWRERLNRIDPFIWLYDHRLNTIQKRSVQNVTRLIANSQYTRDRIQEEFAVDAAYSPYGVDMDGFYPMRDLQRENFVISVGEMSPRKGFDFIVESLGKIPEEYRPELKVASNTVIDNELAYVKGLAEYYQVELDVLVGLGVDELRSLYNRAQFCVYAPVMEPFGLVPLEAMACGTPVVGVREGGVQESVIDQFNGILVNRDAQRFGAAIERLLADPDLIETYGRNGREYVAQNWTWEKSVSELSSLLEKCVDTVN